MPRSISTYRRSVNLVDLFLNRRPDVASYNFLRATNFDAAFSIFQNVPVVGMRTVNTIDITNSESFRDKTRFIFSPFQDYTFTDSEYLWLRIQQITNAGVVGLSEAIHLILPPSSQPRRPVNLRGTAPSGASVVNSLELNLPKQCQGMEIQNEGSNDLFIAFEPSGPEYKIVPFSTSFSYFNSSFPCFSQVFVRGSGGTTNFNLMTSLRNESLA